MRAAKRHLSVWRFVFISQGDCSQSSSRSEGEFRIRQYSISCVLACADALLRIIPLVSSRLSFRSRLSEDYSKFLDIPTPPVPQYHNKSYYQRRVTDHLEQPDYIHRQASVPLWLQYPPHPAIWTVTSSLVGGPADDEGMLLPAASRPVTPLDGSRKRGQEDFSSGLKERSPAKRVSGTEWSLVTLGDCCLTTQNS